jgi:chaperonin cofactor prefoldin
MGVDKMTIDYLNARIEALEKRVELLQAKNEVLTNNFNYEQNQISRVVQKV